MTLPDWLPQDLSHAKLEKIGPRYRLRGRDADPWIAIMDFREVLEMDDPPGYILSRAQIDAEHGRGERMSWQVVWLLKEVAERKREDRRVKRLSRFEVQPKDGSP